MSTNIIDIHTISAPLHNVNTVTQGIEDATGTLAAWTPGCNQTNWTLTNQAYSYLPIATYSATPPALISGTVAGCQGLATSYTVSANPGATSYNWSLPGGWLGTSSLSTIATTVGFSGNVSVSANYTCGTSAAIAFAVNSIPAPNVMFANVNPNNFCSGKTVTFSPSGASTYTMEPGFITATGSFTTLPLTSKVYTLTGTNASGCISVNSATTLVTVKETPTITVNSASICLGESFTITPSGASTYVYSNLFSVVSNPTVGVYNYSVVGTGTNFCVGAVAISQLTVAALPNINIVPTKTAICTKETTSLTASGGVTYSWSTSSTNTIIPVAPRTSSVFIVTGVAPDGCTNIASFNLTVKLCTGIDQLTNDEGTITIFPNPTHAIFSLTLIQRSENSAVDVYNALGQIIISQKVDSEITEINLSNYPNGIYYVKVKNEDKQNTLKLVKE